MGIRAIQPAAPLGQTSTPVREASVKTSETWAKGAILVADTGQLAEAGGDPVLIVGVALNTYPATYVDVANVAKYIPAMPGIEFEGTIDAGSGTTALTQAMLFTSRGLVATSGVWHIDSSETTEDRVVITGLVDAVGTLAGRVRFQFLAAEKIASSPTANTIYVAQD